MDSVRRRTTFKFSEEGEEEEGTILDEQGEDLSSKRSFQYLPLTSRKNRTKSSNSFGSRAKGWKKRSLSVPGYSFCSPPYCTLHHTLHFQALIKARHSTDNSSNYWPRRRVTLCSSSSQQIYHPRDLWYPLLQDLLSLHFSFTLTSPFSFTRMMFELVFNLLTILNLFHMACFTRFQPWPPHYLCFSTCPGRQPSGGCSPSWLYLWFSVQWILLRVALVAYLNSNRSVMCLEEHDILWRDFE